MKDKLTILVPTHFVPSAPSTHIIEATLRSLESFSELHECKLHINYDMPGAPKRIYWEYYLNIKSLSTVFNTTVTYVQMAQQRTSFTTLIRNVRTPYFLFVEHDWIFIERPSFEGIIKAMDNHPNINVVYFNKRPNIPHIYEEYLVSDKTIHEVPLLKTSKWSNNPNVGRMSKWREDWLRILDRSPIDRQNPRKQIEPYIHNLYKQQISKNGFEEAHKRWGCYSYGECGKNEMVKHLDGNRRGNFRNA